MPLTVEEIRKNFCTVPAQVKKAVYFHQLSQ